MPLPLLAIAAALAAGGTLVPHAAGGLIVSTAGGFVAGTYVSTAAIASLVAGGVGAIGAGAALLTGAAASAIGSAGIFGTTVGATGLTGALMSVGLISSTPIWVPAAIGGATAGLGIGAYKYYQLRKKLTATPAGQEAHFTKAEALTIERLLRLAAKREKPGDEA